MSTNVVIIGNGVAGITAARFIRKKTDAPITVISDETDYFYSRPALMYLYMGHMTFEDVKPYEDPFWEKNQIELVRGYVEDIQTDDKVLTMADGSVHSYDVLLVATGSRPRTIGVPGEELEGVQGLYGMRDLERMEEHTENIDRAVVVGGGLIGIEMVEMLHTRGIPVTFLVREPSYFNIVLPPEESALINREIQEHGINLRLETELAELKGSDDGRVSAIVTDDDERIECGFAGVTIGVEPNIEVARGTAIETNRGILVNEYLQTNVPNVYAAGDCTEFRAEGIGHRKIDQLWYTAAREGKAVARNICGSPQPYDSGVFYNSAKFFTIEYQIYGRIRPELPDGEETICWEHPTKKVIIRINYTANHHRVIGFNLMGVRYRHAVCEQWIREGRSMTYVLRHLREANFDPEFEPRYEDRMVELYNKKHPDRAIDRHEKTTSA